MQASPGQTVLLITGDYDGNVPLARAFSRAAPHVSLSSVRGAAQGRQYLSAPDPTLQIVLLDLDAEPAEGLEVLEWLRNKAGLRHIPVVLLTALSESDVIDRAYALGANTCLLKSTDDQITDDLALGIGTYASLVASVNGGGPVDRVQAS